MAIRNGEVDTAFSLSPSDAGGDDTADSDAVAGAAAFEHTFTASGADDLTRDFGFVPELRIGDRVWLDDNGDGQQAGGELDASAGIPGVTVALLADGDNSTVLASTVTDAAGNYFFSSLRVPELVAGGVYFVRIDMDQAGGALFGSLLPALSNASPNDAIDSDGVRDASNPQHVYIRAPAPSAFGQEDLSFDFGFVTQISLGDFVWLDTDGDGVQGASEEGLPGVAVYLLAAADRAELARTVTDSEGLYAFTSGLEPNTNYIVALKVDEAPLRDAYSPTVTGTSGDTLTDSNGQFNAAERTIDGAAQTQNFGFDVIDVDFGLVERFRIGDTVWRESGVADGVLAASGESGIGNVNVRLLLAADESPVAETTTDANGVYFFDSLEHSLDTFTDYIISLPFRPLEDNTALFQLEPTLANAGADDAVDSDGVLLVESAAVSNVRSPVQTENFGDNKLTFDFGFRGESRIGDFVWNDVNSNGVQDAGEPGVPGVIIRLFEGNVPVRAAVSNSLGAYSIKTAGVLVPGNTYRLAIDASTVSEFKPTKVGEGTPETDNNAALSADEARIEFTFVAPAGGDEDLTLDFGLVNDLSIGDFVFLDDNANGVQDAADAGIPGVVLELVDAAAPGTVVATTTSDANGRYLFGEGLQQEHDYIIRVPINQAALATAQVRFFFFLFSFFFLLLSLTN